MRRSRRLAMNSGIDLWESFELMVGLGPRTQVFTRNSSSLRYGLGLGLRLLHYFFLIFIKILIPDDIEFGFHVSLLFQGNFGPLPPSLLRRVVPLTQSCLLARCFGFIAMATWRKVFRLLLRSELVGRRHYLLSLFRALHLIDLAISSVATLMVLVEFVY